MKRNWPYSPLGELVQMHSGGTPSRENLAYWNGTIPWFSGKDLKSFYLRDSIEHISENVVGKGTRTVGAGSLLVLVRGMTLMKEVPVGVTLRDASFNQDVKALLPDPKKLDVRFLGYFLRCENYRLRNCVTTAGHGTGRLPLESLEEYPIPVPPLPEQQKIADILGKWDEALEKLDALIAAKVRRNQAFMQQLLAGRNRGTGKWRAVPMHNLLKRVFRPIQNDDDATLALVSIRRRCGGLFRRAEVLARDYKTQDLHTIKAGDFLISKRQVSHGAWSIVKPEFDGTLVSKEYAILVNRDPRSLNMRFFAWLAQTPRMIHWSRVSSTGVHIEKLIFDPDVFLRGTINVPIALEEQTAIADILDTADAELRLLRQQREALDQQKRGLMQQLLTGKVRVAE